MPNVSPTQMRASIEPPRTGEDGPECSEDRQADQASLDLFAHELNGALTVLVGSLNSLAENIHAWADAPAKVHRALDYAKRGTERVAALAAHLQHMAADRGGDPSAHCDATEAEPAGRGRSAAGRIASILLVDDDDDVRDYIAEALRELNYKVAVACNGQEAMTRLESSQLRFDLLLTDMMLPGTNGCELALEALKRHPNIGVLLMSGQSRRAFASSAIPTNMDMITKPMTKAALDERVKRALGGPLAGA